MSTNYHTPVAVGAAVTSANVNAPIATLDTQVTAMAVSIAAMESEIADAIVGKASLVEAVTLIIGQSPPSSASDTGTAGELRGDTDKLYVCVATDTWKIITLENWS